MLHKHVLGEVPLEELEVGEMLESRQKLLHTNLNDEHGSWAYSLGAYITAIKKDGNVVAGSSVSLP